MEWIVFLILVILLGISIFVNVNLLNKVERLEDEAEYTSRLEEWVSNIQQDIGTAYSNMKQIDIKGSFESDDEVGTTFKALKEIVDEIYTLTNPENNDDTK
jgi:HAMP domain-containing protein